MFIILYLIILIPILILIIKKKWEIIYKISLFMLIVFILLVLIQLISCYTAKVKYPYPALGIEIYNWFDAFSMYMGFYILFGGLPVILSIVLMIVSRKKIKKEIN